MELQRPESVEEPKQAHLSSSAVALVVTNAAGLLLNLVTFLILPRFLGPATWGMYVVWFSLWGLSTQILESGGAVVMNRFLPILRCDFPRRVLAFQRGLLIIKVALLPAVWIIGWGVLGRIGSSDVFHNLSAFTLVVFSAFLYSWASLEAGLQFNFQRMLTFGCFSPLTTLFRLIGVIIFCYILGRSGVPPGLFFGALALWLVYQLLGHPLTRRLGGPESQGVYFPMREYLNFGVWVGLGQFGFLATTRLPGLTAEMLGFDKVEIGWLGLALYCFVTLRVLPVSISSALLPHFVTLAHQENRDEFNRCASESWRYTHLCLGWLLLGLLSLAPSWFPLFLGADYSADMTQILSLLHWTVPAIVLAVWLSFFQQLVYAKGRQKAFIAGALLVLAAFPLGLVLAPKALGIIRLLIALGASMASGAVVMGYCVGRIRGSLQFSIIPLAVFVILTLPTLLIPGNPLTSLVLFLAVQTPLYILLNKLLGLFTSADRVRIVEVYRRILTALSKPEEEI